TAIISPAMAGSSSTTTASSTSAWVTRSTRASRCPAGCATISTASSSASSATCCARRAAADPSRAARRLSTARGRSWRAAARWRSMGADRVMLVGDAANQADPLNGGGIHKAMESAYFAAETAVAALDAGNFSEEMLRQYERRWTSQFGLDWQTAELFLTIAKN